MAIRIDNNTQNKVGHPQTVEDAIRAYSSWAGIHDCKFKRKLDVPVLNIAPSVGWTFTQLGTTYDPEVLVKYTLDIEANSGHGIAFTNGLSDNSYIWIAFEGDTSFLFVNEVVEGVSTRLMRIESEESADGDVMVSY